jgi:site-specific DNA recombinase
MEDAQTATAIYARVSSEQQAQAGTIASQVAALRERVEVDGYLLSEELQFIDDGYSGGTLVRPGLERLRDVVAAGGIDRLYVLSPDRLSRKYAYQVLLLEEWQRCGVTVVFLNHALGTTPEEELHLQMQGIFAEYERAKILDRSRRGKVHAARRGSVSAMSHAPFGYRYIPKHEGGGEARYQVVLDEARIVQEMFQWVAHERCSIRQVCQRLDARQVPRRKQAARWSVGTVVGMLKNTTYKGSAVYGKTRSGPRRARLRPCRHSPEQPRRVRTVYRTQREEQEIIPVPAIVSQELFDEVQERLKENARRHRGTPRSERFLLQGLTVCARCGCAYCGGGDRPYYRCSGTSGYRFGGEAICSNGSVRSDRLDEAVWSDVCSLLSDPARIEQEYERRLDQSDDTSSWEYEQLNSSRQTLKRGIARLIDAYEEGLLEKQEFEPRIARSKERLKCLDEEAKKLEATQSQQLELRLVLGHLEAFRDRIAQGLSDADWTTRRNIVCALIKQVDIEQQEVRIVYRIEPTPPFDHGPQRGPVQDCSVRRGATFLGGGPAPWAKRLVRSRGPAAAKG